MRRALALAVVLAACGGSSSKPKDTTPEATTPNEDAPIENVAPEEPVEEPEPSTTSFSTGAAECDELVKRTLCLYDKANVPAEARKAFDDGVEAWIEGLRDDATRQATIDACKMSLDAMLSAFASLGC